MLIKFLFFIFLHFVADFPLQGDFLANNKGKYDYLLLVHSAIWAGTISIGLYLTGDFALWKAAFLLVGHFLIDRWKARKKDKTHALTWDLWLDQLLHMVQIWYVTML